MKLLIIMLFILGYGLFSQEKPPTENNLQEKPPTEDKLQEKPLERNGIKSDKIKVKVKTKTKIIKNKVVGICKKKDIERIVSRHSKEIRYCYEKELLQTSNLAGKVSLDWIIDPTGKVSSVKILSDNIKNKELNDCLRKRVKRWVFPKPKGEGICRVKYPFIFSIKN